MLYLYLFSAVAGCLLVGVSMLTGGSDSDGDGDGDHAALNEGDAQPGALPAVGHHDTGDAHALATASDAVATAAGSHGSGHGDGHGPGDGHGHHSSLTEGVGALALFLFSLQLWTYLLAFGGLTGFLLRTVAHVGEPMAGLCALGVGLGTAVAARKVMRRLSAGSDSGTVDEGRLLGTTAQVLIPAAAGGTGKVRLSARGQTVDLLARSHDGQPLVEGAEVLILDIKEGVADVTADLDDKELPARGARPQLQSKTRQANLDPTNKG